MLRDTLHTIHRPGDRVRDEYTDERRHEDTHEFRDDDPRQKRLSELRRVDRKLRLDDELVLEFLDRETVHQRPDDVRHDDDDQDENGGQPALKARLDEIPLTAADLIHVRCSLPQICPSPGRVRPLFYLLSPCSPAPPPVSSTRSR